MLYRLSYIHHRKPCPTGAPDRNRTCNRRLRRPMLYPVELRALGSVVPPARYATTASTAPLAEAGRGRGIRTHDIQLPKLARYQTALYPAYILRHRTHDPTRYGQYRERSNPAAAAPALNIDARNGFGRRLIAMARPEGFEPPTTWFVARYSIQLSYGRVERKVCPANKHPSSPFREEDASACNAPELAHSGWDIRASYSTRAARISASRPSSALWMHRSR